MFFLRICGISTPNIAFAYSTQESEDAECFADWWLMIEHQKPVLSVHVVGKYRLMLSGDEYSEHSGPPRYAISVLANGRDIAPSYVQMIAGPKKSGSMRYLYLADNTASTAAALMTLSQ